MSQLTRIYFKQEISSFPPWNKLKKIEYQVNFFQYRSTQENSLITTSVCVQIQFWTCECCEACISNLYTDVNFISKGLTPQISFNLPHSIKWFMLPTVFKEKSHSIHLCILRTRKSKQQMLFNIIHVERIFCCYIMGHRLPFPPESMYTLKTYNQEHVWQHLDHITGISGSWKR